MTLFRRNAASRLGRLDVRLKMAIAFSMSLLVVLVDSLPMLGAVAAIGLVLFLLGRPNAAQVKLIGVTLVLVVWGLILSQGIFYSRFQCFQKFRMDPQSRAASHKDDPFYILRIIQCELQGNPATE